MSEPIYRLLIQSLSKIDDCFNCELVLFLSIPILGFDQKLWRHFKRACLYDPLLDVETILPTLAR